VVLGMGLLTGCGSSGGAATTGGHNASVKAAFIVFTYADYQIAQENGFRAVVGPQGGSVKLFNTQFDPDKMLQQCNDVVNSHLYNVILLQPADPPSGVPCVRVAKAAGIPVIAAALAIGKDPNSLRPQLPGVVASVNEPPSYSEAQTVTV